jgi:choline dehydrogenase-like flavoprotein
MKTSHYDVIVVGAGAGGATAAWAYQKLGYRVCLVERGVWQNQSLYPANFQDWESRRHLEYSYDPNVRKNAADYSIDNSKSPIKVANYNGVGGSTILYSGHFPRFHPSDFATYSLDGVGQDWPISYDDLDPYYSLNERMMGVSGLVGDPAYPEMSEKDLGKPIPIGSYGATLGNAFNLLGWHWWPSYSAISSSSRSGRVPCQNVGPCNTGCPTGAKSSVDKTYIPKALHLGMSLRINAVVQSLLHNSDEIIGVEILTPQGSERILGQLTVLACNAIGTTRILKKFQITAPAKITSKLSKQIGRNLMLHPLGYAEARLPHTTDVEVGPQGCCIYSHEFYETDNNRDFKRGYTLHILRGDHGIDGVVRSIDRGDITFGSEFVKDFLHTKGSLASMTVICEDLPRLENEVYLKTELDNDGLPKVGITYSIDQNTKKMMAHGLRSGKRVLKAAGGKKVHVAGPVQDAGWHLMGTARMGRSAIDSVTSEIGEVHGLSRLFIADGSLFTTSAGVNPASTIQALALYVASSSAQKYLGSDGIIA